MRPSRRLNLARPALVSLACTLSLAVSACTPGATIIDQWFNTFTSLGRPMTDDGTEVDTAGKRADLDVVFVNNTPYRAIFTYGTYDPLNTDQDSSTAFPIKFVQFFVDPENLTNQLDGFSESPQIGFRAGTLAGDVGGCGRAMSVGDETLIELIEFNEFQMSFGAWDLQPEAMRPVCDATTGQARAGIAFFAETSDGPAEDPCESADEMVGWAEGIVSLQGADYPCGGLLIYTLYESGTWPDGKKKFVVELTDVILP